MGFFGAVGGFLLKHAGMIGGMMGRAFAPQIKRAMHSNMGQSVIGHVGELAQTSLGQKAFKAVMGKSGVFVEDKHFPGKMSVKNGESAGTAFKGYLNEQLDRLQTNQGRKYIDTTGSTPDQRSAQNPEKGGINNEYVSPVQTAGGNTNMGAAVAAGMFTPSV